MCLGRPSSAAGRCNNCAINDTSIRFGRNVLKVHRVILRYRDISDSLRSFLYDGFRRVAAKYIPSKPVSIG